MNHKLIIKIVILTFCLAMVAAAMKLSTSTNFKEGIDQLFSMDSGTTMKWCPDHVVDFQWVDPAMPAAFVAKWQSAKPEQIKSRFCAVTMEPLSGPDTAQLQFKPLLLAQSAEAKTALLEWNSELRVFRVQGMPFKSASLSRELLDDPK